MVLLSGILRFVQETRSGNVANKLIGMIHTTACVERSGKRGEIPMEDIVCGDIIHLSAGDMIPADVRILNAKDLFVSQSSLTGESEPVEKFDHRISRTSALTDAENIAFLGSNVISGSARAIVISVGNDTLLGAMAKNLNEKPPKTTFEKGVNAVSWVLIRFMLIMVPVVLFINGFTKGDWMQAALFAISVAVGLTPEMLPMIVTTSLAKGAVAMSKKKVIIKNLNSIQNLGSSDKQLGNLAEKITVFAKLSPSQKARVITVLRDRGHSVGYMGDGINDASALKAADVGISVDTAVDIAKESASVVLLEKDLTVLEQGVIEGRKTYANMMKYIKMTASSNFGNMLSVLAASVFLPFLPMASLQLILLNLIYDISCTAISWDHVDRAYISQPRKWNASGISRFMLWLGPTSSVFDIACYLLMYFILCPAFTGGLLYSQLTDPARQALYIALFQTGWFVESMWSQTLVIHMIRTPKLPFVQSRASAPVTALTFAGISIVTILPFTPLASALGLVALPAIYFVWLAAIVAGYMLLVTAVKKLYIRRFGELL